jgi:serine phosphatase RsbU (regulator of sigma subunit)
MDLAILVFKNEKEVEFAGAQRPLWMIRNNKLTEIKGNKFSIGGMQTETERKFESHHLTVSKGDSLYIFSDGYADQFGGPNGKKFMTKAMKELLLKIQDKSLEEQRVVLDNSIESWRSSAEQVDDILLIGIKIA